MKQILIQNFHPANTAALIRDFKALDYRVIMPKDNWGRISYYFPNDQFEGVDLLTWEEFLETPKGDILVACFEQQNDFRSISNIHGDRILLHTAGNNVPYDHGLSQHLLSPDIQTFNNYPAKHKMLYLFAPIIHNFPKDLLNSYKSGIINAYIHYYSQFWQDSWSNALKFEQIYGKKCFFYGAETRDGQLSHEEVHRKMVESMFTLYFKERDCYGQTVVESMALGTPVIAMRRYVHDKTLGIYFLNEYNSILVDSPEEAVGKLRNLSFQEYENLSKCSIATVAKLTDNEKRLKQLDYILSQN